jgi:hypothetical protein
VQPRDVARLAILAIGTGQPIARNAGLAHGV